MHISHIFMAYVLLIPILAKTNPTTPEIPCILVGRLSVQFHGFQTKNDTLHSGLTLVLNSARSSDEQAKQMTVQADKDGYFYVKNIDSEAIFYPKLISHRSGWTQELHNAIGQDLQPGLQLRFLYGFGSGFPSREPRGGVRVCSIILTLNVDTSGHARWSFSNSIDETEQIVKAILRKLPKTDRWQKHLTAYLKSPSSHENPKEEYEEIMKNMKKYILKLDSSK